MVPIQVVRAPVPLGDVKYHIVFGERRHRACLKAKLPVRAVIVSTMDEALLMEHRLIENQTRSDLSPLDFGRQCKFVIETEPYPKLLMLATKLGRAGAGEISKAISLANLPDEVIAAFPSPADLGYRDAKPLSDALKVDRDAVIAAARFILQSKDSGGWTAAKVRAQLLGAANEPVGQSKTTVRKPIMVGNRAVGEIILDKGGVTRMNFDAGLDQKQIDALATTVAKFFIRLVDKASDLPAGARGGVK